MMFLFLLKGENEVPRIIVKTGYINKSSHKEFYVKYIATRDGVDTYTSTYGDSPATKKQKELIKEIKKDFSDVQDMFEYQDYISNPTRKNASELISTVMDQNINGVISKEKYVSYIANRPRVEKLGKHGLFSDAGIVVNLNRVAHEIGQHEGYVWTHIISLRREDATRLGYDNVQSWMLLCQSKRNELAKAMKIEPAHLKWYAAFHNEGHHPHIHMVVYSTDLKEGFVTRAGIEEIRRIYGHEIFHNDLLHSYQKQTEKRDEIKHYSKELVEKLLYDMNHQMSHNEILFDKISELKESLKNYHGRLMYAYIPRESKQLINDILRELERDHTLTVFYEQWKMYKEDIVTTYSNKDMLQLPLFEQREFKSIKNMILKEVMSYDENKVLQYEQFGEYFISKLPEDTDNELISPIDDMIVSYKANDSTFTIDWSDQYKQSVQLFYGSQEVDKDIHKAVSILEDEPNNILALSLLGKAYQILNDERSEEVYRKSHVGFKYILDHSKDKYIEEYCYYRLGKDYLYGTGTDVDYENAMFHFLQSQNQLSWYSLGQMYIRGLGIEKDEEKAFEYFLKSAKCSNPFALYETARCYELGIGCLVDKEKADYYYKNAYFKFESMVEENENDNLLYRLGMMNIKGKGVEQNIDLGIHFLQKAIVLNNLSAKIQLAQLYIDHDDFEHIAEALEWLYQMENENAYFILGKEYMEGIHVEKDITQAIHYFQKCEVNEYAYYYLYKLYEELYDHEQSIHYLQKAVDMDNEFAQIQMARILIDGIKVNKNVDQAISLLMKAEEKNNSFAQYMLGKLFLFGKEVEQDKEKAFVYLQKSASQGNVYAQYLIDNMERYEQQDIALMVSRFFYHISRIFEQQLPINNNNPLSHVDKKLRRKMQKKRSELGHKEDDQTLHF